MIPQEIKQDNKSSVVIHKLHTKSQWKWVVSHPINPKMNGMVVIANAQSMRILPEPALGSEEEYVRVVEEMGRILGNPRKFI